MKEYKMVKEMSYDELVVCEEVQNIHGNVERQRLYDKAEALALVAMCKVLGGQDMRGLYSE